MPTVLSFFCSFVLRFFGGTGVSPVGAETWPRWPCHKLSARWLMVAAVTLTSCACTSGPAPKPAPPKNYEALFGSATQYFLEGNYISARFAYEEFLTLDRDSPRAAEAEYRIGLCYVAEERYEEAHRYLDRAIANAKEREIRALALLARAEASFSEKDFERALLSYGRAIEVAPEMVVNDELLFCASVAAQRIGDWKTAEQYMRRIIQEFADGERAERAREFLAERADTGEKPYAAQVGAFSRKESAESLANELSRAGFPAYVHKVIRGGQELHCVRVGPFATWPEAEEMSRRLAGSGYEAITVP